MSLSGFRQVSSRSIFAYPLQITRSFAGDDDLEKVAKHVGDIANVTLYVKEFNKWTPGDLQLPKNNAHFTFDNTQPCLQLPGLLLTMTSMMDVIISRFFGELLRAAVLVLERPTLKTVLLFLNEHDSVDFTVKYSKKVSQTLAPKYHSSMNQNYIQSKVMNSETHETIHATVTQAAVYMRSSTEWICPEWASTNTFNRRLITESMMRMT